MNWHFVTAKTMELNTIRFISCRQTRTCTELQPSALNGLFCISDGFIAKNGGEDKRAIWNLSFGLKAGLHVWVSFRLSAPLCVLLPPSVVCVPHFIACATFLAFFVTLFGLWWSTLLIKLVYFCPTQLLGEPGKFPKGSLRAPFSHRCASLHCLCIIFRSAVCRLNCDFESFPKLNGR